jgi:6,7-dimethyl-8-ribityllumazine synthase
VKYNISIVASRFNEEYVNGMLDSALSVLKHHRVDILRVPGAYEIPLAVQRAIRRGDPDAVIALGVIWKGKTFHSELIAQTVTQAFMQIMLQYDTPVIHQVLTVTNAADAKERCFGTKLNRGREAAETVLQILSEERHG